MRNFIFLWIVYLVLGITDSFRFNSRGGAAQRPRPIQKHTILSYKRPPLYTSGGLEGRLTSSITGFALGLGNGLTIGYGPESSGLKKPRSIISPLERAEEFEKTYPAKCTASKSVNLFMTKAQRGAFDIDEGSVDCETRDNINETYCYGMMSILEVNLTSTNPNIAGYEIKIIKGCADKDLMEMELKAQSYKYNASRECWTSPIERDRKLAQHLTTDIDFMNFLLQTTTEDNSFRVRKQSEFCFCEGNYCNDASFKHNNFSLRILILFVNFVFTNLRNL